MAAYVVCRDQSGRLLLTRFGLDGHPDTGKWTLPGGGMEWGESPLAQWFTIEEIRDLPHVEQVDFVLSHL